MWEKQLKYAVMHRIFYRLVKFGNPKSLLNAFIYQVELRPVGLGQRSLVIK